MSDHFTPRNRGSDTRSFYSNTNKRRVSAAQRIRHLGQTTTDIQSYAAGDTLLERPPIPLTENDSEIEEEESNFDLPLHSGSNIHESPMFAFQSPTGSQPLTSSSRFNSSQQYIPGRNHPPSHSLDIGQLLQQQQTTLMKVLKHQEELQQAQKDFSQRILLIEEQVQAIARSTTPSSSSSPSTPISTPKPKRLVPRCLSVSYANTCNIATEYC